mmetsp:Transcript_62407/g.153433  ORF Transcript_62407/g.153433 Transcript_62407/m.153433 type:complete len:205 (+) Transcript_62407:25-639(+)
MLRPALLLAVLAAAAEAFLVSPGSLALRHGAAAAPHVTLGRTQPLSGAVARFGRLPALRMSSEVAEECDGPAKEGAIGNVDVSAAKASSNEIKTDGIITLSDSAKKQVAGLAKSKGGGLVLRVGVRSGGCSGMSYVMEFEDDSKIEASDTELPFDDFKIVVDPKSLMFIYGMTLDYSDALIGGGFKFQNPNADSTCGCGQSFGA